MVTSISEGAARSTRTYDVVKLTPPASRTSRAPLEPPSRPAGDEAAPENVRRTGMGLHRTPFPSIAANGQPGFRSAPAGALQLEPRNRVAGSNGERPGSLTTAHRGSSRPPWPGRGRWRAWVRARVGGSERVTACRSEGSRPAELSPAPGDSRSISWARFGSDHSPDARRMSRDVAKFCEIPIRRGVVDDLAGPLVAHRRHADEVGRRTTARPGPIPQLSAELADGRTWS